MRLDGARTANPGRWRERVAFQQKTVSGQDSFGQDTYTWTDVQECRMGITLLQGRELSNLQQRWSDVQWRGECHWFTGITTDMRVAWNVDINTTRYLDVLQAEDPYGTRRVMQVYLREVK